MRRRIGRAPAGDAAPVWSERFERWRPWVVLAAAVPTAAAGPLLWSLPAPDLAVAATALAILGVPHGAVDHRVARPFLRERLGRAWFPLFSVVYLIPAALILAGWFVAPAVSLLLFLAVSVLHFGLEDLEGRGMLALAARGGAPVALPILLHPERTERFFAILGGGDVAFAALQAAALLWAPVAALFLWSLWRQRRVAELAELGGLAAVFAALPPLAGFAFYFLVLHSPRHMAALAARHDPRRAAPAWRWAFRRSLLLTAMTLAMGGALFFALGGSVEERFLRAVFWGLAALTVPHMALDLLDRRFGAPRLV